ncbi:MAG: site-2 protease family protein [Candidatus Omnitrophica bacterium]|nr:site-2 protease family protein [Candidatus Omnitrophota bacterium]
MTTVMVSIAAFIAAISAHEFAHAFAAWKLGDDTAMASGRLTMNPIAHIDPVGTLLLPALLVVMNSPVVFGWAKPVPIDPRKFSSPRIGLLITGVAGPLANFVLAAAAALIVRSGLFVPGGYVFFFFASLLLVNVVLGVFNLIPIPPLDGSNILVAVLPVKAARVLARAGRYGSIILVALLYAGLLDRVIFPIVKAVTGYLLK